MKFQFPAQFVMSAIALSGVMVSPAMAEYPEPYQQPPYQQPPYQQPPYQQPPYQQPPYQQPPYQQPPYQQPPYQQPPYQQPLSSTSFFCGWVGRSPATFVKYNGRPIQSPLIIWETASNDLSPEERCRMVSWRMTKAVEENGGRLSKLLLTTGKVNGYNVICFVNDVQRCDSDNVIMTLLRRENARNPGKVLAQIIRFGLYGGGSNVTESGGFTGGVAGGEEIIPTAVSIEEAINQLMNDSGGMPTDPVPGGDTYPNPGYYTPPAPAGNSGGGPI
ncbi:hypothetical protein A0J48_004205 [Sphaerospermopsis aphanizomenoides BCCUSP55]|uniref:COP23 domain-containing protein n=1 Tax=Sphaerospermopsis aphanizomenoides TaxID=459663 RepID=UPI001908D67B|nr:COP23 domain-containing protein [Sphaerospermopsis aphanizomenoides]MBK1986751.1 hypothetical protein [Sphaerospermopsis aphanizomenoides BCCUSP55]